MVGRRSAGGATMHDVAELAGVSIKTVSNVLNGYQYIRPETRQRVEAAIEQLGYQLNITARNLRQGRTGMIGLALPELSLSYFAELADQVLACAERRGLTVLIEPTGATREGELAVLGSARRRLTDGLLFSPLALGQGDVDVFRVDYPLVLLGERIFDVGVDHVTMQNTEAARAATEYLLRMGCRRIAAIGEHPGETIGSAGLRLRGYVDALVEAGVEVDQRLVAEAGLWHRGNGAEAMSRLLDAGVRPDGVFCFNDALALGALHVLEERGMRVPDDVAVIGFDDIDEARYSHPPLTTVSPGRDEIAQTAVGLLADRILGVGPERPVEHRAQFRIVERGSTRPSIRS